MLESPARELQRYAEFWESLSPDTVERARDLVSPDIRFRDPFNDLRGIRPFLGMIYKMFEDLADLQFRVTEASRSERLGFINWRMTFKVKMLPGDKLREIEGVTRARFDEEGRVYEHVDFWDGIPILEGIPVAGLLVSGLKRLLP